MKKKNLVIFFSSLQTPIPEMNINFFLRKRKNFKKIYFVECFSNSPLRIDLTFLHGNLRKLISSLIRNGISKKIKYLYNIYKLRKKYKNILYYKYKHKINEEVISNFNQVYSNKEFNTIKKYFCQFSGYSFLYNLSFKKISRILNTVKWSEVNTKIFLKKNNIVEKQSLFLIHNAYHPIEKGIYNILSDQKKLITENNGYLEKFLVREKGFHDLETFSNEIKFFYQKIENKNKFYLNAKKLINKKIKKNPFSKKIDLKKTILFLSSSINEFSYTYKNPTNQIFIIKKLLNSKTIKKKYNILVRVHPNCASYSNHNKNIWDLMKINYPENIISYNEKINTYKLIQKSLLTMSIGSVTGLESIILGKNHILFGKQSMWSKLGVCEILSQDFNINKLLSKIKKISKQEISIYQREMASCSYLYEYIYGQNFIYPLWSKYAYSSKEYKKDFIKLIENLH